MKLAVKCGVVCILGTLLSGSVSAAGVSLGIKGGLNLVKPWGDKDDNSQMTMKPGLIIGAALGINIVDMFSIQPEVLFSSKGFKWTFRGDEIVQNINYIEIPVLFKLNIPAGIVIPNLYFGPAVAFLAGAGGYTKIDGTKRDITKDNVKTMIEGTKPVDFGLAMGGGININAGPGSVVVDVRYTLGIIKVNKLTDADKASGFHESDLPTQKNGALSFMAGYVIVLGGK